MSGFPGFPEGTRAFTPLPDLFFSDLLPQIDDLSELKVTLYCLWLVQHKPGEQRYIAYDEIAADEILMHSLEDGIVPAAEALREALERAVARGTLLAVTVERPGRPSTQWYFVNSEHGRATVGRIERGEWVPVEAEQGTQLRAQRPNIYNLYEQNMGMLSPMLAEELRDAERTYPQPWIEDAFRIAVANNVRRWSYVRGILERWAREGRAGQRDGDSAADRRRYIEGKYADQIKH
ncbi:MAG: DnaD domain protein [Anaerolineae bacterium]|nr:DnaD domain protein [Anaerolineae bacterium]